MMNRKALPHITNSLIVLRIVLVGVSLILITGVWSAGAEQVTKPQTPGPPAAGKNDVTTESLNKQITDLDAQIQKLRDQSLELQEKTRAKLQSQLENLKKQQDVLLPRIEQLRDNSETAWEEIKENIQKAIEDLKQSVDSMKK
jgi:DNA anti-recombination protein RmuC